ncbi:MAG TPA: response regulator [Tepidisphaeraceae bacterium]|nr:response regulator [Tepidisphaeraceae bacterium]
MSLQKLAGRRVMIVEDEVMVATLLEDVLDEEHCTIIGPFGQIEDALDAARTEQLDLAVLDVNLGGIMSFPVAEMLAHRGIPFLLLTGYGDGDVALERALSRHRHWPVCGKPFDVDHLVTVLEEILGGTPAGK